MLESILLFVHSSLFPSLVKSSARDWMSNFSSVTLKVLTLDSQISYLVSIKGDTLVDAVLSSFVAREPQKLLTSPVRNVSGILVHDSHVYFFLLVE